MPSSPRRQPRQARALATRAAIFEATAQILETDGEAAFNTNRVAERAGVSVGTLYQYFADKQAILVAMAHAEIVRVREHLTRELGDASVSPVRLAIRAQIGIMRDRPATRRAALRAILAAETVETIARETRATQKLLPPRADPMETFVVSRAVAWVIRAAVLEASPHLTDPGFEDALVRLSESFGAGEGAQSWTRSRGIASRSPLIPANAGTQIPRRSAGREPRIFFHGDHGGHGEGEAAAP